MLFSTRCAFLLCFILALFLSPANCQSVSFSGLYTREDSTSFSSSNVGSTDIFKFQLSSQSTPYYEGLVITGWVNYASSTMSRRVYLWTNEYSDGYLRTNYANNLVTDSYSNALSFSTPTQLGRTGRSFNKVQARSIHMRGSSQKEERNIRNTMVTLPVKYQENAGKHWQVSSISGNNFKLQNLTPGDERTAIAAYAFNSDKNLYDVYFVFFDPAGTTVGSILRGSSSDMQTIALENNDTFAPIYY